MQDTKTKPLPKDKIELFGGPFDGSTTTITRGLVGLVLVRDEMVFAYKRDAAGRFTFRGAIGGGR